MGRYFKLWGDHYSFPAEAKGVGKIDIRPKSICVTSNYAPEDIWADEQTHAPIYRRYKVYEVKPQRDLAVEEGQLVGRPTGEFEWIPK